MPVMLWQSIRLALSDYLHERLLSACAVLGLAAVLTPLLVLFGVKHGIISSLTENLLSDPRNLEISPVGSGRYTEAWLQELREKSGVSFVLAQTRSIAATMDLRTEQVAEDERAADFKKTTVALIPTAPGDPLLARWGADEAKLNVPAVPSFQSGRSDKADHIAQSLQPPQPVQLAPPVPVVLSEPAARKLAVRAGDNLRGSLGRVRDGKREAAQIQLTARAVLPLEAQQKEVAFVPLPLLVAGEDYRDGRAVPALGWPGESAPEGPREYPSFRLYAANLDDVENLRQFFLAQQIEVYTRAEAIETVKSLDWAFTVIFALISGAAMFGFVASTASSALAGVRRKSRSLGLIRLMGFSRSAMLLFPLLQSVLTGFLGSLLAFSLYLGVAFSIDQLFSASLTNGQTVCSLLPLHFAVSIALVLTFSALASFGAAWQATKIEPSEVIRDV